MLNYLIITAAVIIALVIISSVFWGDFPILEYNNQTLQIVCRTAFVVAQILLLVSAFVYPYAFITPNTGGLLTHIGCSLLTAGIYALGECVYCLCIILALCFLGIMWDCTLEVIGWAIFDDRGKFILRDDD